MHEKGWAHEKGQGCTKKGAGRVNWGVLHRGRGWCCARDRGGAGASSVGLAREGSRGTGLRRAWRASAGMSSRGRDATRATAWGPEFVTRRHQPGSRGGTGDVQSRVPWRDVKGHVGVHGVPWAMACAAGRRRDVTVGDVGETPGAGRMTAWVKVDDVGVDSPGAGMTVT